MNKDIEKIKFVKEQKRSIKVESMAKNIENREKDRRKEVLIKRNIKVVSKCFL